MQKHVATCGAENEWRLSIQLKIEHLNYLPKAQVCLDLCPT